jgi:hypothetical protein
MGMKRRFTFKFHFSTMKERMRMHNEHVESGNWGMAALAKSAQTSTELSGKKWDKIEAGEKRLALQMVTEKDNGKRLSPEEEYKTLLYNKVEKKHERLRDADGKRIRNNRTADGKRKKFERPEKPDPIKEFWKSIGIKNP